MLVFLNYCVCSWIHPTSITSMQRTQQTSIELGDHYHHLGTGIVGWKHQVSFKHVSGVQQVYRPLCTVRG